MAVKVKGWNGVAFRILGPASLLCHDEDGNEYFDDDPDQVRVCMVGDDRVEVVDKDDCTELAEEDYCHECGQIGCTHDGLDRG